MNRPRWVASVGLAALLAVGAPVQAQRLDAASTEALAATLRMLQDPALRGAALAKDPKAAGIDSQMRGMLGGDKHMAEFYELAAQIFEDLTRGSGGDVQKMTQALERGRSDPAGFAAMLSPRTLERLRTLSGKLSDRPR
jgi:hypothetical protein